MQRSQTRGVLLFVPVLAGIDVFQAVFEGIVDLDGQSAGGDGESCAIS
jgi:hypothetical protein